MQELTPYGSPPTRTSLRNLLRSSFDARSSKDTFLEFEKPPNSERTPSQEWLETDTLDSNQGKIAGLQTQIRFFSAKIAQYEQELEQKNRRIRDLESSNQSKSADFSQVQARLTLLAQSQHSELTFATSLLSFSDAETKGALEAISKEKKLTSEFLSFSTAATLVRGEIVRLREESRKLSEENRRLNEDNEALRQDLEKADGLKEQLEQLQKEAEQLQAEGTDMRRLIIASSREIERQHDEISRSEKDREDVKRLMTELGKTEKRRDGESWVETLKRYISDIELVLCKSECEIKSSGESLTSLKSLQTSAEAALIHLFDLCSQSPIDTVQATRALPSLATAFPDLVPSVSTFLAHVSKTNSDFKRILSKETDLDANKSHILDQFQALRKNLTQQEELSSKLIREKKQLNFEGEKTREALSDANKVAEHYENLISKLAEAVQPLFDDPPETLEDLVEALPATITDLLVTIDTTEKQACEVEREVQDLRERNNEQEKTALQKYAEMTEKIEELNTIISQNESHSKAVLHEYEEVVASLRHCEDDLLTSEEARSLQQNLTKTLIAGLCQAEEKIKALTQVCLYANQVLLEGGKWKTAVSTQIQAFAEAADVSIPRIRPISRWKTAILTIFAVLRMRKLAEIRGKMGKTVIPIGSLKIYAPKTGSISYEIQPGDSLEGALSSFYTSYDLENRRNSLSPVSRPFLTRFFSFVSAKTSEIQLLEEIKTEFSLTCGRAESQEEE